MSRNKIGRTIKRNKIKYKKAGLKNILPNFKNFITFFIIVGASVFFTGHLSYITSYWLYTIWGDILCGAILIFSISLVIFGIKGTRIHDKVYRRTTVFVFFIGIAICSLLGVISFKSVIPNTLDIPAAVSHNFNKVEGTIVSIRRDAGRSRYVLIEVQDKVKGNNVIVKFEHISVQSLLIGQTVKVEYLPHSKVVISYSLQK